MNNQVSYTLNLDANITGIVEQAEKAKKALENIFKSGNAPAGLEKAFERLNEIIASIKEKTKEPLTATSDFSSIENDVKKVLNLVGSVIGSIDTLSETTKKEKITLLPPETQEQLANAAKALKAYTSSMEEASKASKELREAQSGLKKSQINREAAENLKKDKENAIAETKKKINTPSAAEEALEARIREAEEAKKELEEAQKALEKLSGTDKRKKEYRDAKKRVGEAQARADSTASAAVPTQEEIKAIEAARQAREAYRETLENQQNELKKITKEVERATLAEAQAQARVDAAQGRSDEENLKKKQKAYDDLYASAKKIIPGFDDLGISMEYSEENADKLLTALKNLENKALKTLDSELENSSEAFKSIANSARGAKEEVRESQEEFKKMGEAAAESKAFENKIKQFLGLSGAAQVLRAALRDAMQTITELDSTMTEMAVVTDLTVGDYWDQLPEYSKQASDLGVSINSAYKAATLYYQQGLKGNEVTKISAETLKMAKIAGLDAADATDKMTAALRGFNMELNETSAQRVADVYSQLAAITAADVDEISSAMTKTASIAHSAGMEFETTAAFLSQIIETTRESAETAGTALKTVIARFQELKKDPSEIGEVDGEIVDANAIETALRSVGVSLRNSEGQFRELDDVFLELSSKWDSLDKNTQRYIATIAAGSRQQSRFIAMMSDYGRTQELVSAANDSAGASNEQFEKTMDSLEAKLEKLKNAWHEFTMGILNSELVKTGVDILTAFMDVINKATSTFKGFGGSITKIASVLVVFKIGKKIFEKMYSPFVDLFQRIIEDAKKTGEQAGDAAQEGLENSKNKQRQSSVKTDTVIDAATHSGERTLKSTALEIKDKATLNKIGEAAGAAAYSAADAFVGGNVTKFRSSRKKQKESREILTKGKDDYLAAEKKKEKIDERRKATGVSEEELKELDKQYKELEKSQEGYRKAAEDYATASEDMWSSIGDGISSAGEKIMGFGVAVSMVGGMLEKAGYTEFGETLQNIGSWATMVGATLTTFGPLLSKIGVGVNSLSLKLQAAGWSVQAAWIWVAVIALAVVAIVAAVVAIFNAIKKNSPEYKLEQLKKATEAATQAAEQAKEAYSDLSDSIQEIADNKDAFKGLVKGTREWKEALLKNNTEILEFIEKYPELASLVQRDDDGILTIDTSSPLYTNFMDQQLQRSFDATISSSMLDTYSKIAGLRTNLDANPLKGIISTAIGGYGQAREPELVQEINAKILTLSGDGTVSYNGPLAAENSKFSQKELDLYSWWIQNTESGAGSDKVVKQSKINTAELADAILMGLRAGEITQDDSGKLTFAGDTFKGVPTTILSEVLNGANLAQYEKYGEQVQKYYDELDVAMNALVDSVLKTSEGIENNANGIVKMLPTSEFTNQYTKYQSDYDTTRQNDRKRDDTYENLKDEIVEKAYGPGAILKGTTVTLPSGETLEDITDDVLKSYYAAQKVGNELKKLAGQYENVMQDIIEETVAGDEKKNLKIYHNFLNAFNNGLSDFTKDELDWMNYYITHMNVNMDSIWNDLETDTKNFFNNSKEVMLDAFNKLQEEIDNTIDRVVVDTGGKGSLSGPIFKSYMNYGQGETYANKLEKVVAEMGVGEANQIDSNLDILLGINKKGERKIGETTISTSINERNFSKIQDLVNATNWSSVEELLALQIDLTQQFGYSKKEAEAFTNSIKANAGAVSSLTAEVQAYGQAWKNAQKIQQANTRISNLQWKYENAQQNGLGTNDIMSNMLSEYTNKASIYSSAFEGIKEDLAKVYAQGGIKYKADLRNYLTIGADGIDIDTIGLQEAIDSGKVKQEEADEWVKSLEDTYKDMQEQLEGLQSSLDAIEQLEEEAKQSYYDLRDMAKEAVLHKMQEQIEIQRDALDATKNANTQIINKLQEQINSNREQRQREETESNIGDLYSQLAYTQMSSSGNGLQAAQLQDDITKLEQDYEDTLIDQAIQKLSDSNEKAAEQRERQISLAEQQLDAYANSWEFSADIENELNQMLSNQERWQQTELGNTLTDYYTSTMTAREKEDWSKKIGDSVDSAVAWTETEWDALKLSVSGAISGLETALGGLKDAIDTDSTSRKIESQVANLSKQGFNVASLVETNDQGQYVFKGTHTEADLNKMSNFAAQDDAAKISALQQSIDSKKTLATDVGEHEVAQKFQYLSQKDFYGKYDLNDEVAKVDGEEYKSYTDYLTQISQRTMEGVTGLSALEAYGGVAVPGQITRVWDREWSDYDERARGDVIVNGEADDMIRIEKGKPDDAILNKLNYIDKNVGQTGSGIVLYQDTTGLKIYVRQPGGSIWRQLINQSNDSLNTDLIKAAQSYNESLGKKYTKHKYKTGGLADFTGPAWLDGTPSKPEYVLSAAQTEKFFELVNVLESFDTSSKPMKSGDNYFNIDINVEKIESDYDVEQMADKIRKIIYEDSTYRNVNAVNLIR